MTTTATSSTVSWVHALGILRGAVEGDDVKYMGSVMGFDLHVRPLLAVGLVAWLDDEEPDSPSLVRATDAGRAFYAEYLTGLEQHTVCRANYWVVMPEMSGALQALAAHCEQRPQAGIHAASTD
ncbi:hypothetical protein PV726_32910 [Streptomyces europaeiscabiei]|uniref:hypothetical protein n=1 Tax=Streptomyces europaeiscabiei TaxID=146819 RepID=UPI0029A48568|nr:hypothetical protein [Streptomyces europaeiscabiei]MDX3695056.1 hypothetical protein [Streptomyces europaeiscabiei]